MFPKKIYLNYDGEEMWSGEPVSVTDCELQSREYTDLRQVWHPASKPPKPYKKIVVEQYKPDSCFNDCWVEYLTPDEIDDFREHGDYRWAYIIDLMPPATYPEISNSSSKQSKS